MEQSVVWPELESAIGYRFQDRKLLETALTHSSYANEQGDEDIESFERLEFLGDAVTGLEVALLIFQKGPMLSEGQMTAARAAVVKSESLARIARFIGLGAYLRLGVGAERTDVRESDAVLEDALEALMAAVFLDGGSEAARGVIRNLFTAAAEEKIRKIEGDELHEDYKTRLQMEMQKNGASDIQYSLLGESGPDHDKSFFVAVFCNGKRLGTGEGKTKKYAEKMAAKMALEGLHCI
jgi:ribonuclease-3